MTTSANAVPDRERFERWYVVAAALRLSYGIAGERAMLLGVIERGPS